MGNGGRGFILIVIYRRPSLGPWIASAPKKPNGKRGWPPECDYPWVIGRQILYQPFLPFVSAYFQNEVAAPLAPDPGSIMMN